MTATDPRPSRFFSGRPSTWWRRLHEPVDSASLVVFRVAFGLLLALGVVRFFLYGWIDQFYGTPSFHFTYLGFDWIRPWPLWAMKLHFVATGLAALAVAFGVFYRVSVLSFFLLFTYLELIDKTTYLNHYYLVSLVAGLMLFMPLAKGSRRGATVGSRQTAHAVPAWCLVVLRLQFGLVYFYAGVAKLGSDWLLRAEPLRFWLPANDDLFLLGPLLAHPWAPYAASWFGAVMDLTAPFFLSYRRTRPYAFALVTVFHLLTAALFNLGLFPWLMIVGAALFFPPDWPRRLATGTRPRRVAAPAGRAPAFRWQAALLCLYFGFQFLWPLRHHLYSGHHLWTTEGFRFAWNVMLVEKAGRVVYEVKDGASGRHYRAYPEDHLTPLQAKMMATRPDMILQYARHLASFYRNTKNVTRPQVFADAVVSLHGRPPRRLIDPNVDLIHISRWQPYSDWVLDRGWSWTSH